MGYSGDSGVKQLQLLRERKAARANTLKKLRIGNNTMLSKGITVKTKSHRKASPDVLASIAENAREERKTLLVKRLIVLAVLAIPFVMGAVYVLGLVFQMEHWR